MEEQKRIKTELEREQKRMREGSLGGSINVFGEPIPIETIDAGSSNPINYTKVMAMPDKIILVVSDSKTSSKKNNSSFVNSQIKLLPKHMDVFSNSLSRQVSAI
ncbi:MAG: hypothetical protein ACR5KV_07800 [Wolbachia sp.]